MKTKGKMKVVGYARTSSNAQIENTSIEEQKKKIEAYCFAHDYELVEVFVDEAKSATTNNRESYQEMMGFVKDPKNEIKAMVVLRADRIHRKLKNLLIMVEDELEPNGVAFVSVSEKFDTSSAQGMLFLQMIGSFSEFERKIINERTRSGRLAKAKKNEHAGGELPHGYVIKDGEISIQEEEAEIIKSIFKDYADGYTIYKIAKQLNKAGKYTRKGKQWSRSKVRYVLQNETYTGINTYNGKKEKNQIVQKDLFPKIISKQLWNKVRARELSRKEDDKYTEGYTL